MPLLQKVISSNTKNTSHIFGGKNVKKIDEGLKEMINSKLNYLNEHIKDNNEVIITYFIQDKKMMVNILTK